MTIHQALVTLSMLALPLGTSCNNSGGDSGMACQPSDTSVGTDTSTWPDGLEATVVAFEALEGTWIRKMTCTMSGSLSSGYFGLTLTPGPRSELYLLAPVGGATDACTELAQGIATVALLDFATGTESGTVDVRYAPGAATTLSGTLDGGTSVSVDVVDGGLQGGVFQSADGSVDCAAADSAQPWARVK